jgi:hypothetical protein
MGETATIEQSLAARRADILDAWAAESRRAASARGLSRPELMNIMPKFLSAIVRPGDEAARREEQMGLIHSHLSSRLRAGFELDEVLEEVAILGRVIVRIATPSVTRRPEASRPVPSRARLSKAAPTSRGSARVIRCFAGNSLYCAWSHLRDSNPETVWIPCPPTRPEQECFRYNPAKSCSITALGGECSRSFLRSAPHWSNFKSSRRHWLVDTTLSLSPSEGEIVARADDWTTHRVPARIPPRGTSPFDPRRLHRMAGERRSRAQL